MKATRFIISFMVALLFSTGIGAAFGAAAGVGAFTASMAVKAPGNSMLMAVTPEVWTDYIVENLFKDNEFILQSIDESQYVIGTGVVHIPQAGSPSKVERNRKKLPATITRRKDVDVTYVLDEFTTDPRFIPNIDKAELSYDKMDSCISEDMAYLKEFVAEAMMYNWRPDYFITTTGSSVAAHYGSGDRKAVTLSDFKTAKETFNKWQVPKSNRNVLIDTDMLGQLQKDLKATSARDYSVVYDPVNGEIKKLETFTIIERATTLVASAPTITKVSKKNYSAWSGSDLTYTPEHMMDYFDEDDTDTTVATTSSAVAIFWEKTKVSRALGVTEMFDDEGNPQYYGDIYSFLQRAGGRKRRGDSKGVLGLIQKAA